MKPNLLFAMLPMVFAVPGASAATELETLRTRCTEQEQQIKTLEAQIQSLRGGSSEKPVPAAKEASQNGAATGTYVVQPGDFIERIARRNHCSPVALAKANGLKTSSVIHPGQKLKLPESAVAQTTSSKPSALVSNKTHTIRDGETYFSISRKYGIPVETLIAANPNAKATALRTGQVIRLSTKETTGEATPQAKPQPAIASAPVAPATPARPATPAPRTTPVSTPVNPPAEPKKTAQNPPTEPKTTAQNPPVSSPKELTPSPSPEKKIRSVTIDGEMTYAEFAAKHGTDIGRLNDLNGLDLTKATVLAKGSELYVPAQP